MSQRAGHVPRLSRSAPALMTIILVSGVCLYAALWRLCPIGSFNDDATAIVGAKSILSGRYVHLQNPDQLPLKDPPPGFSILLAPAVALVQPHWDALKAVSLMATLVSDFLLWLLLDGWIEDRMRLLLVFLFAINPLAACESVIVMAEASCTTLILLAFLLLRKALEKRSTVLCALSGLCAGIAALFRPQSVLLIPALAACFALKRQWRKALVFCAAALWGPATFWARNAFFTPVSAGYSDLWSPRLLALSRRPLDAAAQMGRVFRSMLGESLLGFLPPRPHWILAVEVVLCVAAVGLIIYGAMENQDPQPYRTETAGAATVYIAGIAILQTLWIAVEPRYFLGLLPLLLFLLGIGLNRLAKRPRGGIIVGAFLAMMGASYGVQDARLILLARQRTDRGLVAASDTIRWIRSSVPEDARILTNKNTLIYLLTDRYTYTLEPERTLDEFRRWVLTHRITWAVLRPESLLNPDERRAFLSASEWLASVPHWFPLAYANTAEHTRIYRILPSPAYLEAWRLYDQAVNRIDRGALSQALELTERALGIFPQFPLALTTAAALRLRLHRNIARARSELLEALNLEPTLEIARDNLRYLQRVEARDSAPHNLRSGQ